jgi:hypothetical protein
MPDEVVLAEDEVDAVGPGDLAVLGRQLDGERDGVVVTERIRQRLHVGT